ncbi:MAG: peptidase M14, partial [Idiomarina sp. 34-48-12]
IATDNQVKVHAITSGLTPRGMDLGSRNLSPVKPVNVMMVVGTDANMYEAGEAWYYLDRHVGIPVSMVDTDRLNRSDLSRYTHIIMVDGRYSNLNKHSADMLRNWVNNGGVIIGQQGGAKWLSQHDILGAKFVDDKTFREAFKQEDLSYGDMDDFYGQRRLAGAIFEVQLDTTHPLAFGYPRASLPVFKDSTNAMVVPDAPFVTVAKYSEKEPLLAGFTAKPNREVLADKAAIVAHRKGSGRVIAFADDMNFRAFFYGSAKLLSNAIFLAPEVRPTLSDEENAEAAAAEAAEAAHAH